MQKDFTNSIYSGLIFSIKKAGYAPFPFIDIISNGHICEKYVVVRHDIGRDRGRPGWTPWKGTPVKCASPLLNTLRSSLTWI